LRRKLDKHGVEADLIETVRSDGYIYKGPVTRS
jgi:DNA-binding winged helix-turn-helix (wHTH) protein